MLRGERDVLGHIILSQDAHALYGGVVPEIAARAHLAMIDDVVAGALREAGLPLDRIEVFAATAGPGLIGALLVGVTWTKTAAFALERPFVPVHHMEAHLFATSLDRPDAVPPFVALLVSGGHTLLLWVPDWGRYELLGETRDDAAGEAFDKVAKILGLGYPGGPEIERLARDGDPRSHVLPRPMLASHQQPGNADYYAFSFSGLKTAVLTRARALEAEGRLDAERANLAASFQAAVVETLAAKTERAVAAKSCRRVVLGGGVAASDALRVAIGERLGDDGVLYVPSPRLATDNAAMIARAGLFRYERGEAAGTDATARADLPFPGLLRAS